MPNDLREPQIFPSFGAKRLLIRQKVYENRDENNRRQDQK